MEYCDSCKEIKISSPFYTNKCINCLNTNKLIISKQGGNEILLNPCQCHNFGKINAIVSRICMIEVKIASLLSELGKLKTMISECEVK